MKTTLTALCIFASSACLAAPFDDYSNGDVAREGVFAGLMVLDYKQTLNIKSHPPMYETNKLLGTHPSDGKVGTYFATTLAAHTIISYTLPKREREVWQWVGIVLEAVVVSRNKRLGLSVQF